MGFETVTEEKKTEKVKEVFDSVATNYDLMNDMMSMGVHRLWKRFMLSKTGLKIGMKALDVAGGTGDIAALLREQVGESGLVVMTDINQSMLDEGRSRLLDRGKLKIYRSCGQMRKTYRSMMVTLIASQSLLD